MRPTFIPNEKPAKISSKMSEKFRECIVEEIGRSGYVVADKILQNYKRLCSPNEQQEKDFLKLDQYLFVREANAEVNASIAAYYYSNPVRLVHECEQYVLNQMKSWMKVRNRNPGKPSVSLESFEALGIGDFYYNEYAMNYFKYRKSDVESLKQFVTALTTTEIMNIFLDIVAKSNCVYQQVRATPRKGSNAMTRVAIPADKKGIIIGSRGSTLQLLQDITNCTIDLKKDDFLTIRGDETCVEQAVNLLNELLKNGPNCLKVPFQQRFEQELRYRLQLKYPDITQLNLSSFGVIVDAKAMHYRLVDIVKSVPAINSDLETKFKKQYTAALMESWKDWMKENYSMTENLNENLLVSLDRNYQTSTWLQQLQTCLHKNTISSHHGEVEFINITFELIAPLFPSFINSPEFSSQAVFECLSQGFESSLTVSQMYMIIDQPTYRSLMDGLLKKVIVLLIIISNYYIAWEKMFPQQPSEVVSDNNEEDTNMHMSASASLFLHTHLQTLQGLKFHSYVYELIASRLRELVETFITVERKQTFGAFQAKSNCSLTFLMEDYNKLITDVHFSFECKKGKQQMIVQSPTVVAKIPLLTYNIIPLEELFEETIELMCGSPQFDENYFFDSEKEAIEYLEAIVTCSDEDDGLYFICIINSSSDELSLDAYLHMLLVADLNCVNLPNKIPPRSKYVTYFKPLCFPCPVKSIPVPSLTAHDETVKFHWIFFPKEDFLGLLGMNAYCFMLLRHMHLLCRDATKDNKAVTLQSTVQQQLMSLEQLELAPLEISDAKHITSAIIEDIWQVETKILSTLKVPHFAFIGRGNSFIHYLLLDENWKLRDVLFQRYQKFVSHCIKHEVDDLVSAELDNGNKENNFGEGIESQRNSLLQRHHHNNENIISDDKIVMDLYGQVDHCIESQRYAESLLDLISLLREWEQQLLISCHSGYVNNSDTTFLGYLNQLITNEETNDFAQRDDDSHESLILKGLNEILYGRLTMRTDILSSVVEEVHHPSTTLISPVYLLMKELFISCIRQYETVINESKNCSKVAREMTNHLLTRKTIVSESNVGYSNVLKDEDIILLENSNITKAPVDENSVICFANDMLLESQNLQENNSDTLASLSVEKILERLLLAFEVIPFGVLCSKAVNWNFVKNRLLPHKEKDDLPMLETIPLFIQYHKNKLSTSCQDKRKFCIISYDDAIVLPEELPTVNEIKMSLTNYIEEYNVLAAWFILANQFSSYAKSQFYRNVVEACKLLTQEQYNNSNKEYDFSHTKNVLCDIGCKLGFALPAFLSPLTFSAWFHEICPVCFGNIEKESVDAFLLEFVQSLSPTKGIEYTQQLTEIILYQSGVFPSIETYFADMPISNNIKINQVLPQHDIDGHPEDSTSTSQATKGDNSPSNSELLTAAAANPSKAKGKNSMVCDENDPTYCHKIIDEISETEDVKGSFRGSFRNSIELLSKINSCDVHFVLEIIQNAADNSYATTVIPTLKIQLFSKRVVVQSNEVGFSTVNVKAITSVGSSHKKKSVGFIGHKGIGFKTVFAVTDCPEIHSKGFHFRFDKREGSMLAPYWIENTGSSWPNVFDNEFVTHIHLPLHKEALMNFAKLQENLKKVFDPNLLLFLKKLSIMILEDYAFANKKSFFRLERTNLTKNWILCSSQQQNCDIKSNIWYVKRTYFQPTVPRKDEVDIAETEIAIAVHFEEEVDESLLLLADLNDEIAENDDIDLVTINKNLQKASIQNTQKKPRLTLSLPSTLFPVYSFLPTRMTVCKFIIQADFILVTNRESIEEQHAYNHQLLEQIQQLVVGLFQEIIAYCESELGQVSSNTEVAGLLEIVDRNKLDITPASIVQLLPKPSNTISTVFKELNGNICKQLSSTTRLFLSSSGKFVHASDILYTHHIPADICPIEQLLPESLLFSLTKKYYLHSSIQLDEEMLALFQISKATSSVVIDCMVAFAATIPDKTTNTQPLDENYTKTIKTLSALWILLHRLFETETVYVSNNSQQPSRQQSTSVSGPVPTQLRKKAPTASYGNTHSATTAATSKRARTLSPENVKKLQQLTIWPVHTGNGGIKFFPCDNNILFLPQPQQQQPLKKRDGDNNNNTVKLSNCLKFFRDKLHMIDEAFLKAMEERLRTLQMKNRMFQVSLPMSSSLTPLTEFIQLHFRASIVSNEPNMILEKIVKPTLQLQSDGVGGSTGCLPPKVCCAMLAYAFIVSKQQGGVLNLFESNCWIPSVIIRESNESQKYFGWLEDSEMTSWQSLKRQEAEIHHHDQVEVHMGIEIEDSGAKILSSNLTALRQCKYRIFHPLVTCLAFQSSPLPDHIFLDDRRLRMQAIEFVSTMVDDVRYKQELSQWKIYLEKLNIIKFFTIYKDPDSSKYVSETLQSFFGELLKNAEPVDLQGSMIEDGLSLYFPNGQSSQSIIQVSSFVFTAISKLVDILTRVLPADHLNHKESREYMFVKEFLMEKAWLPVQLHPKLSRSNTYWLARADSLFYYDMNKSALESCWPHALYLHSSISEVTAFNWIKAFCCSYEYTFMNSKVISPINHEIFIWSSQQPIVYASISWMNDLYQKISDELQYVSPEKRTKPLQEITNMLNHPEQPFIWFPFVHASSSDRHLTEFCKGKFYPFHCVVVHDVKHTLPALLSPTSNLATTSQEYSLIDFPGSPIRVLSLYYNTKACQLPSQYDQYNKFFQRRSYCKICYLMQGTMSCKGLPLKHEVPPAAYNAASTLQRDESNYTSSTMLRCDCEDTTSFGLYTMQQTGLLKMHIGPEEVVRIASYLSEQYHPKKTHRMVQDEENIIALSKEDCLFLYQGLLHWLNRQLWKCFSLPAGMIWPYTPTDLQGLVEEWRKQNIWYTSTTARSWTSLEQKDTSSILYLMVDNHDVYKQFQSKLHDFIANFEQESQDDYQLFYKTIKLLPILSAEYCKDYTLSTTDSWKLIQQVHTNNTRKEEEMIGMNFSVNSFQMKYDQYLSQSVEEIRRRWNDYFPALTRLNICNSFLLSELCQIPNLSTFSRKEYNYTILAPHVHVPTTADAAALIVSKDQQESDVKAAKKVYDLFQQQYHKVILITLCYLQKYQSKDISSSMHENTNTGSAPLYMTNIDNLFGLGEFYELLQLHHYVTESLRCDVSLDFTSLLQRGNQKPHKTSPYKLVNSTMLQQYVIENRRTSPSSAAAAIEEKEKEFISIPEQSKARKWIFLLSKDMKIPEMRVKIREFFKNHFFIPLLWKTMPSEYQDELLDLIKGTESVASDKLWEEMEERGYQEIKEKDLDRLRKYFQTSSASSDEKEQDPENLQENGDDDDENSGDTCLMSEQKKQDLISKFYARSKELDEIRKEKLATMKPKAVLPTASSNITSSTLPKPEHIVTSQQKKEVVQHAEGLLDTTIIQVVGPSTTAAATTSSSTPDQSSGSIMNSSNKVHDGTHEERENEKKRVSTAANTSVSSGVLSSTTLPNHHNPTADTTRNTTTSHPSNTVPEGDKYDNNPLVFGAISASDASSSSSILTEPPQSSSQPPLPLPPQPLLPRTNNGDFPPPLPALLAPTVPSAHAHRSLLPLSIQSFLNPHLTPATTSSTTPSILEVTEMVLHTMQDALQSTSSSFPTSAILQSTLWSEKTNTNPEEDEVVDDGKSITSDLSMDEMEEDELGSGIFSAHPSNQLHGRVGESIAKSILMARYEQTGYTIQWMNEHQESWLPYDFIITQQQEGGEGEGEGGGRMHSFVEVKTRVFVSQDDSSDDRKMLEREYYQWFISPEEIDFCRTRTFSSASASSSLPVGSTSSGSEESNMVETAAAVKYSCLLILIHRIVSTNSISIAKSFYIDNLKDALDAKKDMKLLLQVHDR